jgi:hypothetical protein
MSPTTIKQQEMKEQKKKKEKRGASLFSCKKIENEDDA